ncbi:DUF4912 domain-containing protein [Marinicrinis sediminis]|uniref:DUF4912 domain-containing protein n=1 Tax=Marinicrinis sediminis TaxID=1652465 RepID=A0ABW5RE86_9BACL
MEENRIWMMPKSPTCLFVYWDLTQETKEMLQEYFETDWMRLHKRLRLHDVTGMDFHGDASNQVWDLEIRDNESYCFLSDLKANRSYGMDYGVVNRDGNWIAIMRSNVVGLPPDGVCTDETESASKRVLKTQPEWLDQFTGYSLIEQKL